jgi:hypothetical protein
MDADEKQFNKIISKITLKDENRILLEDAKTLDLARYINLVTIILKIINVDDRLSIMENCEMDLKLLDTSNQDIENGIINNKVQILTHQYRLVTRGSIKIDIIMSLSFNTYL